MIEAAINAFKRRKSIVTRYFTLLNSIKKDELFSKQPTIEIEVKNKLQNDIKNHLEETNELFQKIIGVDENLKSEIKKMYENKNNIISEIIKKYSELQKNCVA